MAHYLIDTDVMIDVSRGSAAAATYVDSLEGITISIITAHELIVGARNHRHAAAIDGLIRTFPVHADLRAELPGSRTICSKSTPNPMGCELLMR